MIMLCIIKSTACFDFTEFQFYYEIILNSFQHDVYNFV